MSQTPSIMRDTKTVDRIIIPTLQRNSAHFPPTSPNRNATEKLIKMTGLSFSAEFFGPVCVPSRTAIFHCNALMGYIGGRENTRRQERPFLHQSKWRALSRIQCRVGTKSQWWQNGFWFTYTAELITLNRRSTVWHNLSVPHYDYANIKF